MKNVEVGNLVRFSYDDGSQALGIVTWEYENIFKAIWSDGNPYKEMDHPLSKDICITGVWEVINFEEETKMTNAKDASNVVSKVLKGNTGLGTTTITVKEDELTVAQEACNNAYMAINGILQAHAEKNGEPKPEKLPQEFYNEGWNDCIKSFTTGFTFSDFDTSVKRTWKKQDFKDAVSNASLGLTGEAGEVADLIKKAIYHGRGFLPCKVSDSKGIDTNDVKDELSDVLFYVSAMAQTFGFSLEDVARHNKEKLEKRYENGFTVEESANKRDKQLVSGETLLWGGKRK